MTYREWCIATCSRFQMSEAEVELLLTNQYELIADPDDFVDVKKAKTAIVKEFANLIPLANISEGGYSVSWNMDAIKLWYRQACSELGIADTLTRPVIRNKSNIW